MSEIDYTKYTYKQLLESKSSINTEKYPENYAALIKEFSKRQAKLDVQEAEKKVEAIELWRRSKEIEKVLINEKLTKSKKLVLILGWIQVLAAAFFLYLAFTMRKAGFSLALCFVLLFVVINAVCGVTLLFEKKAWY